MLVSHRGQQLTKTKEEYDDDNEGTITTTSCRGGQEVSYRRRHGHDDRWFCDERDEQDQDHETEREVAFADELPRRARGDLHRATGGSSGLDSKIGDLDRRMISQSTDAAAAAAGDESGEERRRSPVSSFTAVVDITTSTSSSSSSSAARLPLVAEREDDEQVHAAALEQDQSEQDVEEDEEEEEEENEEDDEEAELVEVDEDEAERAEEVAEELAAFDAATEHLLHLLDELRDDNGRYRYRRGQVVAVAGGRSSTVIVSFPASHEMDQSAKHQRVVQKKPDARDIPRARHIILRFCDSQQSVEAKIVCKEPWGVRVEVLEERPDLSLSIGTRYWARFTGTVSLITNIPVLEAMHPC
ncbi:uncharacterized protein ACA1_134750 [Acanthamoeba castellanii str. Neff]|uniref:Uncharacterized protein n=1 Tax=Acanthamoeba castellanii (strain ATCC 30010 / Neff) TaxID=1257118 RepID=L8GF51_ACACF|nr:uncharacterized protein ACA1_134750 [Acanthamoeba castellanii str. Neff]ELR11368.1 hypothetical protein ACA1_134750 [Acanthamoeba castellanii str. Neff]